MLYLSLIFTRRAKRQTAAQNSRGRNSTIRVLSLVLHLKLTLQNPTSSSFSYSVRFSSTHIESCSPSQATLERSIKILISLFLKSSQAPLGTSLGWAHHYCQLLQLAQAQDIPQLEAFSLLYESSPRMRGLLTRLLIALTISTRTFASPAEPARQANVEEDVLGIQKQIPAPVDAGAAAGSTNSEEISDSPSTFNGVSVPPMKELKGETFDTEVKDGYWYGSLNFSTARWIGFPHHAVKVHTGCLLTQSLGL